MNVDTFTLSLLFDTQKTEASTKKVESTVDSMIKNITKAFLAFAEIDFFKNLIEQSVILTTKLDNLAYTTRENVQSLSAWGEAVKRNGGTAEGFYTSISSLASKLRDIQTSFGSPGQLVFARLGLNLRKANGEMKTSTELLGDIGEKFKHLPKAFQLNLGQQLGLDPATIRLISNGSKEALALVEKMRQLSGVSEENTERNLRFRNSLYDIQLIWQSIKLTIANAIIPILTKFSEMLVKTFRLMQEHAGAVKLVLLAIAGVLIGAIANSIIYIAELITTRLIPAFLAIVAVNPELYVLGLALVAAGIIVEDFTVYLRGGKSAFEDYYKVIGKAVDKLKQLAHILLYIPKAFYGLVGSIFNVAKTGLSDFQPTQADTPQDAKKSAVLNSIALVSKKLGFDPNTAATISNIESGLDPDAKSKTSTASGLFQVLDSTALDQLGSLENKNNPLTNSLAGIKNLQNISTGLNKFFKMAPTGGELYLGEHFGLKGAKKIFSANPKSLASSLFSSQVTRVNPDIGNLTSGQLINNANKTYASHAVSVGKIDIQVHAPQADAAQVAQQTKNEFQRHLTSVVTNKDNGVKQ
jgi:hypothetical protein